MNKMRHFSLLLLAGLQVSVALADQENPCKSTSLVFTPVRCQKGSIRICQSDIGPRGFRIKEPGTYCLVEDIRFNPCDDTTNAITINANNVTLNLNGHTIRQVNHRKNNVGIFVESGVHNVEIMNGSIEHFGAAGIFFAPGFTNVLVDGVTVKDCGSRGTVPGSRFSGGIIFDNTPDDPKSKQQAGDPIANVTVRNCVVIIVSSKVISCVSLTRSQSINNSLRASSIRAGIAVTGVNGVDIIDCSTTLVPSNNDHAVKVELISDIFGENSSNMRILSSSAQLISSDPETAALTTGAIFDGVSAVEFVSSRIDLRPDTIVDFVTSELTPISGLALINVTSSTAFDITIQINTNNASSHRESELHRAIAVANVRPSTTFPSFAIQNVLICQREQGQGALLNIIFGISC